MLDHRVRYHSTRLEWTRLVMVALVSFMLGAMAQRIRDAQMMAQCVAALDHAHDVVSEVLANRRCK